jgi:hypothetical protein
MATVAQTSTYLAITDIGSQEAMARFDAQRTATEAAVENLQRGFRNLAGRQGFEP